MKNNFENGSFIAKCKNDMDVFPLSNAMNTEFRSIFFLAIQECKTENENEKIENENLSCFYYESHDN